MLRFSFQRNVDVACLRKKLREEFTCGTVLGVGLLHIPGSKTEIHGYLASMRRFRVPYSVLVDTIVPECQLYNVFGTSYTIPVEFKVLVSLRLLGRGNCLDDVEEMSGIPESTCSWIFMKFITNFTAARFDAYVFFPDGEELKTVQKVYDKMGFPITVASMDCTRARLGKCPVGYTIDCTGKEGFPTLSFNFVCGPNRKIFYCGLAQLGKNNDNTVQSNDQLCKELHNGKLQNVEGIMYDSGRECQEELEEET